MEKPRDFIGLRLLLQGGPTDSHHRVVFQV